ncbi:MAG: transposase [Nitrospira sp.]|nr:transposase [Nitrospira sp.]
MKLKNSLSLKTRQQYSEEFRAEATRLVRDAAQPVVHVARNLSIADHLLSRWRAEQQQADRQGHTRQSMHAE